MTDEQKVEIIALAKRHPIVNVVMEELSIYKDSPLENSYLAVVHIMDKWNKKIETSDIDITNPEDKIKFEMVHKYIIEMDGYLTTLEKIRNRMLPESQEKLKDKQKQKKLENNQSVAI